MIYQVNRDGNAPNYAKKGDHVVTGGGTYEILDPKIWGTKSEADRKKAGVGYNPTNNLYSRKITDPSNPYYTNLSGTDGSNYETLMKKHVGYSDWNPLTYDTASDYKDAYIRTMLSELESDYNSNLAKAAKSYNTSRTSYNKRLNQIRSDYTANMDELRNNAYRNANLVGEQARQNGTISSGQAAAARDTMLMNAARQNSVLRQQMDYATHEVELALDDLAAKYNVTKDELLRDFNSGKTKAMSQADAQFLSQVMEIDKYNSNLWNSMVQQKYNNDYQSLEAQKQRDFNAAEAQKDRDFQMQMYNRQRSSGRSSGSYSYNNANENAASIDTMAYMLNYKSGRLTDEQKQTLDQMLIGVEAGYYTPDEWMNAYNEANGTYRKSGNNRNSKSPQGIKPPQTPLSKFPSFSAK